MALPVPQVHTCSFEEFLNLGGDGNKYEWVDGRLISMPVRRAGSQVQHWLARYLEDHVLAANLGFVGSEQAILVGPARGRVPDVYFVSWNRADVLPVPPHDMLNGAPELAVEVLSPGAEAELRDRIHKREQYGRAGVLEYWIVDPAAQTFEVYRAADGELRLASTLTADDMLTTPLLSGFTLSLPELWRRAEPPRPPSG